MEKIFSKIICLAIITSLAFAPFFSRLKKAEAESLSGYIQKLAPVILKMPGCKKEIGATGTSDLFSKIKDLASKNSTVAKYLQGDALTERLESEVNPEVIDVSDAPSHTQLGEIKTEGKETKKATKNMDKNQNCLNGIAKAISKVLIAEMTDDIVNWIQTGNSGNPMFNQNSSEYFKDLAREEILRFGVDINDPQLFPFGKDFMQVQANSYKYKFANNAQYSLNKMIYDATGGMYTDVDFQNDFSQGGWAAWNAMTQYPANNPLGFALIASNELNKRIEEKTTLAEGSLQASGGYFGVEKCIDPEGVTKEEHDAALAEIASSPMGPYQNRLCKKWETITPGKLVGDLATEKINERTSSSLDVETLNDAIAAILDAALAKFTGDLMNPDTGLAYADRGGYYQINAYEQGFGDYQTEKDYTRNQINASTWLQDHPDFDIRNDLNQALIDEQRIYADKLKQQNDEIFSTVPLSEDYPLGNYGLIPTIYQLDYCIPGPHPGWEEEARWNLEKAQSKVASIQFTDMTEGGFFQLLDSLTLGMLGAVVSLVNSFAFNCGSEAGKKYAKAYMSTFDRMTGYDEKGAICRKSDPGHVCGSGTNEQWCAASGFDQAVEKVQQEYERVINKIYAPKYLPSAAKEAKTEFGKIEKYYEIMGDNNYTIDNLAGVIRRLTQIKKEVEDLNDLLADGKDKDEYEEDLKPWKAAFARLSSELYSGDDIAKADNITRQIIEEKEHVYKDLIKSATGCEEEVAKNTPSAFSWMVYNSSRPKNYPRPHLYSYEEWGPKGDGRLCVDGGGAGKGDLQSYEMHTFTPRTTFVSWGGYCTDGYLDCFDLSLSAEKTAVDSKDPNTGGYGKIWEQALAIW